VGDSKALQVNIVGGIKTTIIIKFVMWYCMCQQRRWYCWDLFLLWGLR